MLNAQMTAVRNPPFLYTADGVARRGFSDAHDHPHLGVFVIVAGLVTPLVEVERAHPIR